MLSHALRRLAASGSVLLIWASMVAGAACSNHELAFVQPRPPLHHTGWHGPDRSPPKLDVLLVVDNTPSMIEKQTLLARAVPAWIDRLTNPFCVDRVTGAFAAAPEPGEPCPDPSAQEREFEPIQDIHVGVISSSLGGHGADSCSPESPGYNPQQQDMAHLLDRGRTPGDDSDHRVPTWNDTGFLNWAPGAAGPPPGDGDLDVFAGKFADLVRGVGSDGCGFPAPLEAWYRFLVDPAPVLQWIPCPCFVGDDTEHCRCPDGIDSLVLQQRHDMIRQDSAVVVVMISDRNDCSLADSAWSFQALQATEHGEPFHLAPGTAACRYDADSDECKSCSEFDPADAPAECAAGWPDPALDDPMSLRCYDQKRRFGIDFLHPIERYVDGLTEVRFEDGTLNPLFCRDYATIADPDDPSSEIVDPKRCAGQMAIRDPSQILLVGVVGVPWQDIARDPRNLASGYRTAQELSTPIGALDAAPVGVDPSLAARTLWDVILGETGRHGEIVGSPLDPLMLESVEPRSGTNPITGAKIVLASESPLGNPINGSDRAIASRDDLQYACIFDLPVPVQCTNESCDCFASPQSPLCFDGTGFGPVQYRAKAYPARRQLAVLKGLGDRAVVASICPAKTSSDRDSDPDWGYLPAITAIAERIPQLFPIECFPVPLWPFEDGSVPCTVIEANHADTYDAQGNPVCPPCEGARSTLSEADLAWLRTDSVCIENNLNCACELRQLQGDALQSCIRDDVVDPNLAGWCYVDGENPDANHKILQRCPADEKRRIRFVGRGIPAADSLQFISCRGGSLGAP
jgi:hypothetical protein